ncbi:adenylate/guanylate cyclase domain-containing protein [Hoeflea sp.]|uniref:adenylate/guanylate cyclase domain-containing protein n=1 Tax=Hoeflea sp. TaxID=1940281 RepID=UPI003B02A94B
MSTFAPVDVEQDLALAEQAGLRLMLKARTVVLALMIVIISLATYFPTNMIGAGVLTLFLASGLIQHQMVGTRFERWWHRYAFFSVDIVAIAAMLTFIPLSLGSSEIPQIFVFRTIGVEYTFALVALSALSLTPGLVLWVGSLIVASLWTAYLLIVSGMERTLSWEDLPAQPSREEFLGLFFNPDFIGSQTRFIESFFILSCTAVIALVVHRARGVVRARATADRQRRRALEVFGQYVPPQIAQRLLESEASLLPESRTASVLFVDIEGFTRLSESKSPENVIALLNTYFDVVTDIVSDNGGVVISFVGDAVVAAFNAPLPVEEHARQAVRAAHALLETCASRDFEGETIRIRIGVATGPVAAGCVGGGQRQAYTVYGDTVNLAQRLEALNKEHGTRAMFLQATTDAAGSEFEFREIAKTSVRGRSEPVNVFTFARSPG